MTDAAPTRAIASILELPFAQRSPHECLGIAGDRATVDLDYAGFGWTVVDRIWLADATGVAVAVDRPLVLALHAADDSPALADDVLLEFALPAQTVTVLLSGFLGRWRPRLPPAPTIVLAMCNPHRARLPGPPGVHYALGPVDSWLDDDHDGERLRLVADAWRHTGATTVPEAP